MTNTLKPQSDYLNSSTTVANKNMLALNGFVSIDLFIPTKQNQLAWSPNFRSISNPSKPGFI
jgi:hypothetical protein